MSKRLLFLGVYGMEVAECGGALALNTKNGGETFVSMMFTGYSRMDQVEEAAKLLGVKKFYDNKFERGKTYCDYKHKMELIRIIRETRPDIIITQDPEHIIADLDPDRRPVMNLILESIALASRDFGLEEMPDLKPHPIPKIYYMSPLNPNCTINIAGVWDLKEKAMDTLSQQMSNLGKIWRNSKPEADLDILAPGWKDMTDEEVGRTIRRSVDLATHMYHGAGGHGNFALAEPYRYEGHFEFEELF